ncbi:glucosaminidase [Psychromonas sp. psych-6C06]|uniref:glucosaminidase domain-containing protein n=1 Tax=Psychromonas sp. psych-6C06 TaxID=2058089 RepID=UPI000C332177|nr:glucosaminidase domain-containing protein [Psychromonas sp. psych-6C06]PKF61034.1 glucosaminidase [Psychromonas sp. psych-6C06]
MFKHITYTTLATIIGVSLSLTACSESNQTDNVIANSEQCTSAPKQVSVKSLDELNALFTELNYTEKNWNDSTRDIPCLMFKKVSSKWVKNSPDLPVETKKTIFFRLMSPLILMANEEILQQRKVAIKAPLGSKALRELALNYAVIKDLETPISEQLRSELLSRIDIVPVSLALAQAAEESGWGTSRFALEGNAFFGQWDFSGNGMKPKQQREHLGNYGVAKFDSPLASVKGYMFNINTNKAYANLRSLRAEMRDGESVISGYELASTLDKYSERGEAYIKGLRRMIRVNKLQPLDEMKLDNRQVIALKTSK